MQLSDLRTEVMSHGFDPTQFGSARVNQYINDGYQLVCSRVDYYVDEATQDTSTVVGTATYSLPADMGRLRSFRDTVNTRELEAVDLRDIDRSPVSSGAPRYYALDAANLHVYPTPDGVYSLELRYWKTPAPLVNDTDVPTLPTRWHYLLWQYAVAQAYKAEDAMQQGQTWMQDFANGLAMFAADVKFPNTDRPTQIKSMWDRGTGIYKTGWSLYGTSWGE